MLFVGRFWKDCLNCQKTDNVQIAKPSVYLEDFLIQYIGTTIVGDLYINASNLTKKKEDFEIGFGYAFYFILFLIKSRSLALFKIEHI